LKAPDNEARFSLNSVLTDGISRRWVKYYRRTFGDFAATDRRPPRTLRVSVPLWVENRNDDQAHPPDESSRRRNFTSPATPAPSE
jgi:hypothetical protein